MRILKRKRWILSTLISVAVIASFLLIPWVPQSVGAVAPIYPLIHYLDDLLDVNVTAPTDNYVIYWNNTSGYWEARAEDIFVCGDLVSCNISELGNVNAAAPNDNDILFWNDTAQEWQTKVESGGSFDCKDLNACSITNLSDVNVTSPAEYDFLIYDSYSGMWLNQILSSVALQIGTNLGLHQLSNVNATLLEGYILYWDLAASEFKMRPEDIFVCGDLNTCNISELANVNATSPSDGDFLSYSTGLGYWQDRQLADTDIPTGIKTVGIIFIIDGIGSAITTGEKGHLEIPFNCTIQQVTMAADQTGSIVVDIWKDTYANFPPTNADSITNATPPTITTALKSQDSTLTNWTTTITTGDILAYNVSSCTNITRLTVSLQTVKT